MGHAVTGAQATNLKTEPETVDKKHFDVLIGKKTPEEALKKKSDDLPLELKKIDTKIAQAEQEYGMMAKNFKRHIEHQEAMAIGGDRDYANYSPLNPFTEDDKSRIFDFTAKAS